MGILDAPFKFPNADGIVSYDERLLPTLKRYTSNPTFTIATQNPASGATSPTTSPSIYWPWIVNVKATGISSPLDNFYMYYSTDHDATTGGIYLATGPTPIGPWTGRGLKYVDLVSPSAQTETPSVIWNDETNLFHMYYQQYGVPSAHGVQTTLLATSPDGLSWTRIGIAIDVPSSTSFPGDGHTGYFKPFKIGRRWYGYHLMGGANYPHFGISTSSDGITWIIDPRPLGYGADQFTDGRRIEWNSGDVLRWRGQLWWVGICSNFSSGISAKDARLAIAPLAADFRHIVGTPIYQLYPTVGSNESANYRAIQSYVFNGRIISTYQCDSNFNVAMSA